MESLDKYKILGDSLISKINNKFSIITFLTIDEIIKDEIDLRPIWWELAKMNDTIYEAHKVVEEELENLSEEDYDEWGYEIENEIDGIKNKIEWKVMSLQTLLDGLDKLKDMEEEYEILKRFRDIKPLEI
jgi:hypothetical protein